MTSPRSLPTLPEHLPPYGVMWKDFEDAGLALEKLPKDWIDKPAWPAWIAEMRAAIADNFWPRFDDVLGWQGGAAQHIVAITLADLEMIEEVRALMAAEAAFHAALFRDEDEGGFHRTLAMYQPDLAGLRAVLKPLEIGAKAKYNLIDLQLKQPFRRPRPYQAAVLFGRKFTHDYALWSFTSSTVSGHALHAALVGAVIYESLWNKEPARALALRPVLQRWCMDVGDRRIFSGVHYPGDSLASMFVALRLLEHVFTTPQVHCFLARAIRNFNRAYKVTGLRMAADPAFAAAFRSGWKLLEAALQSAEGRAVDPADECGAAPAGDAGHAVAEVGRKDQR